MNKQGLGRLLELSEEDRMHARADSRKMERQKTTKEDLGAGLEAHGEMSMHCNIWLVEQVRCASGDSQGEGGLKCIRYIII